MSAPPPTERERLRLRRLVQVVLIVVVVVQSAALVLAFSPAVRAQVMPVIDATVNRSVIALDRNVSRLFQTANDHLGRLRRSAESNDRSLAQMPRRSEYAQERDVDSVTVAPLRPALQRGTGNQTGISFADRDPVRALRTVVPGAVKWENYGEERLASSEMALLTLRGGVASLNAFNRSIQDGSRLTEISRAAQNATSDRALSQLQIQAQVEVARQLHALRAQQALQTNLYAITESHRVGLEARQYAQDHRSNCEIMASLLPSGASSALCSRSGSTTPTTR